MNRLTELFVIGKIVKTSGLKGRLKIVSYLESGDSLQSFDEVYLRQGSSTTGPHRLKGVKVRGNNFLVEMEGVEDCQSADALSGCQVLIPITQLKTLPEHEYYWRDIIGLTVVTEEGHILGIIEAILPTGGNDVYVVSGGEREILLPGIADVILEIDIDRKVMVVRLLEGL